MREQRVSEIGGAGPKEQRELRRLALHARQIGIEALEPARTALRPRARDEAAELRLLEDVVAAEHLVGPSPVRTTARGRLADGVRQEEQRRGRGARDRPLAIRRDRRHGARRSPAPQAIARWRVPGRGSSICWKALSSNSASSKVTEKVRNPSPTSARARGRDDAKDQDRPRWPRPARRRAGGCGWRRRAARGSSPPRVPVRRLAARGDRATNVAADRRRATAHQQHVAGRQFGDVRQSRCAGDRRPGREDRSGRRISSASMPGTAKKGTSSQAKASGGPRRAEEWPHADAVAPTSATARSCPTAQAKIAVEPRHAVQPHRW